MNAEVFYLVVSMAVEESKSHRIYRNEIFNALEPCFTGGTAYGLLFIKRYDPW